MELKSGTLLQGGKYRIMESIGRGGFGTTYLAEQVMAERKVCIKEFFPEEYYNRDANGCSISLGSQGSAKTMETFKAKFIKEAKTIAKFDHTNIIHIHDVFEENGTAYYVMEYVEGESLSAVVKRRGALGEAAAVGYIRQVADALSYIHEQRIMHLDVKPGNVMLRSRDDRAILIDFGLSKHYDADSGEATSTSPVGVSHGFAPMEQYKSGGVKEFSPATDIYSLGATLYYLVTGLVPPEAADVSDEGLPALPAHLSQGVRTAIERSMADKRKARPQSIDDFLKLLEDNTPEVVAIPTPKPTPSPVSAPVSAPVGDKISVAASAPVADERTVVGAPAPKAQPTPQSKNEWTPKYSAEKPMKSEETKKKSKWWMWLLIVAVVAIGGYLALSGSKESEVAKSEQVQNHQAEEIEKASIAEEAEKARIAEEKRQAEEAEKARIAEEAEKARIAEEKRQAEEAEKARIAEEQRLAEEEAARKAEQQRITEQKKKDETVRKDGPNLSNDLVYSKWGATIEERESNIIASNSLKDALDAKDYKKATVYFQQLLRNCPGASMTIYARGATLYGIRINMARNLADKRCLIDSLMYIYDVRNLHFGSHETHGRAYILDMKARDALKYSASLDRKFVRNILKEAVDAAIEDNGVITDDITATYFKMLCEDYIYDDSITKEIILFEYKKLSPYFKDSDIQYKSLFEDSFSEWNRNYNK